MKTLIETSRCRANHRAGQTLVITLIVMGVLLAVGFVFLSIVSRNIQQTSFSRRRTAAAELAEGGIRYAHAQLLRSQQGADWRPALNAITTSGGPDMTRDPDILYIRPGTGYGLRDDADPQRDLGGPDGLGSYTRIDFQNGRSLIRVRYAPSDANIFSNQPSGPLRNPGKARTFTIIESVGRPGRVTFNDPTTLGANESIQFQTFPTGNDFRLALGKMRNADTQITLSGKAVAFASIGIIEGSRFITDKFRSSRPAEIGVPQMLGATYAGVNVATGRRLSDNSVASSPLTSDWGTALPLFNFGNPPLPTGSPVGLGASLYSNPDLRVHGEVYARLNIPLGEIWAIAGLIYGADADARLIIESNDVNGIGAWVPPTVTLLGNGTNPSLNSRSDLFSTNLGLLRDAIVETDAQGYPRGTGRKEPPSAFVTDPDTGMTRYVLMTRETGPLINGGHIGRYGHGSGIYVNNAADRQTRLDEQGREQVGTAEALVDDWLNPNNGQSGSGWQGPFYVPRGCSVFFGSPDSIVIVRDEKAPATQRYWRAIDGSTPVNALGQPVQTGTIRYRFGVGSDGQLRVINTFTPDPVDPTRSIDIDAATPNFDAGEPFNGVMFFEGNVRVRGAIPTDIQFTMVSNATVYIEGSITKGVSLPGGGRINRPSRSTLMVIARDYVALNTTQFFGTAQALEEVNETQSAVGYSAVRMRQPSGTLTFITEFPLNPSFSPADPSNWQPYAINYREFDDPSADTGPDLASRLMLTHTMDDGPAPASFIKLDVNYGVDNTTTVGNTDWVYQFFMSDSNAATQPFIDAGTPPGSYIPVYGLGVEPWQRYSRFESIGFPLVDPGFAYNFGTGQMEGGGAQGTYVLFSQDTNDMTVGHTAVGPNPTNDFLVARAALAPHDVRIEASLFAEDGSFFVIPGPPFNPNPSDRREVFNDAVNAYGGFTVQEAIERAQRERTENFGTFPETPFYGEPLDVRITILGAVSENMPPPMDKQAHWIRRWGWIPAQQGAQYDFSGPSPRPILIPKSHVPNGFDIRPTVAEPDLYVPNLIISYDPVLATARVGGFSTSPANPPVRQDADGRVLPPMPRLPVSPTLSYFGEVNP